MASILLKCVILSKNNSCYQYNNYSLLMYKDNSNSHAVFRTGKQQALVFLTDFV